MAITVGSKAPDFALRSRSAQGTVTVKLSDNFGKRGTMLLFVPAAFTGVCTEQLCGLSKQLPEFEDMGIAVYGISVDMPYSQQAWAKDQDIRMPLLSDFAKAATLAYDIEEPDFAGLGASVSKRAIFLIDREGIVRYVQVTASTDDMPDFDELATALNTIQL